VLVSALGLLGRSDAGSVLTHPFQCFGAVGVFAAVSARTVQGEVGRTLVKGHVNSYSGTRRDIDSQYVGVIITQDSALDGAVSASPIISVAQSDARRGLLGVIRFSAGTLIIAATGLTDPRGTITEAAFGSVRVLDAQVFALLRIRIAVLPFVTAILVIGGADADAFVITAALSIGGVASGIISTSDQT